MKSKFSILFIIIIISFLSVSGQVNSFNIKPDNCKNYVSKNCFDVNGQKPPFNNAPDGWYELAIKKIEESDYAFLPKKTRNEYISYNTANRFDFIAAPRGLSIKNRGCSNDGQGWETAFDFEGITKGAENWNSDLFLTSVAGSAKLRFIYDHFEIEYINDKSGIRQNFIINKKPAGDQKLTINMSFGKMFRYELKENNKLYCYRDQISKSSPRLIYDELKVWDASGKQLNAHMELDKNNVSIIVDDKNAVYPVTVDPLSHSPEWVTTSDGILTTLLTNGQLQTDALYGFNVCGLGDVNGDGFDDVAIGAPGAINIIGPSIIVGAGAVFVYFGSPTGLSTVPDRVLRATTPVANALFGYSVAGGNVTGNTRNDIIVGAPGDSYTTSVSGFPSTAHVTAGKLYVFRGEDMSIPTPTPFLSVFLTGSTYFTNGVLGLLGPNISSNALFGFSVAATEDMDGDGLGEVIAGAPGYAELGLTPIKSGAAFIYYSGSLGTNSPVKLTAPTASLLGIPLLNDEGLLFGFSVDGLGDYNQDGKPDVVVGAPAGVTLSPGNFLGGSAYVYKGTGTGVNLNYITQLKAAPSLLGTITNLFGYSVRGVRNANGVRNGNVLVGAPSGNLLSNVLNGLQLKAGSVNVFKSKTNPLTEEIPAQTLQSPRTSSFFTILTGLNLNITALFGASMDNMLDVNCDGINDIIVGEPLSTSVGIINANVVGGAATIFLGKADGTYDTSPFWNLENQVSYNAGINAGSLLGYSVAGARHVRGSLQGVRCLVGAPGAALDFSSGIFNLGNAFGTLFGFTAGNNGLGKSYLYGFNDCNVLHYPDINVTYVNVPVPGDVSTNDVVPSGSTYGTPIPSGTNPPGGSITLLPDGTYTFTGTTPGVFIYLVPVCLPGESLPYTPVELTIYALIYGSSTNPPVANTDIASTLTGVPVILKSLENDRCSNLGCGLNNSSVQVTVSPHHGTVSVNLLNGDITYTSNAGFTGKDTLTYIVCDNAVSPKCASAKQVITIYAATVSNTTLAADDYTTTYEGLATTGNVKTNDTDPENNSQAVVPQSVTSPGKGSLVLNADGSYVFTPATGYVGPVNFPYTTCDNGTMSACASATLYILIIPIGTPLFVKVNSFTFNQKNCGIQLNWTTTQDNIIQEYIIDQSVNGLDWVSIGMIDPHSITSSRNDYSFTHTNPLKGQNYYRLVMLDKQGMKSYSNVLNVNVACSNVDILVNPNPFADKVNIYFTTEKPELVTINLFNNAGNIVLTNQVFARVGSNQVKLTDLGWLASGVYIIQVKTSTGVLNQRLLK